MCTGSWLAGLTSCYWNKNKPVKGQSPAISACWSCDLLVNSPEKFLVASMVVRMAPWGNKEGRKWGERREHLWSINKNMILFWQFTADNLRGHGSHRKCHQQVFPMLQELLIGDTWAVKTHRAHYSWHTRWNACPMSMREPGIFLLVAYFYLTAELHS